MISACIITKNEIENLKKCIETLRKYPCEIVVIDTGSTDGSLEFAREYADVADYFEWCDDFSKARNFASSKASNNIILSVDTDEYVESMDGRQIEQKITKEPYTVGLIKLRSPYRMGNETLFSLDMLARIYDRRYFEFKRPIHEQILPIEEHPFLSWDSKITAEHVGYISDERVMREKYTRNLEMLRKYETDFSDVYTLYQMGKSYLGMGELEEAAKCFEKTFDTEMVPTDPWVRNMMINYGYLLINLGRKEEALDLEGLWEEFPNVADFSLMMGCVYIRNCMMQEGLAAFERALTQKDSDVDGANSYLANYNIGVIYECTGDKEKALLYYKRCGQYPKAIEGINRINVNEA